MTEVGLNGTRLIIYPNPEEIHFTASLPLLCHTFGVS